MDSTQEKALERLSKLQQEITENINSEVPPCSMTIAGWAMEVMLIKGLVGDIY